MTTIINVSGPSSSTTTTSETPIESDDYQGIEQSFSIMTLSNDDNMDVDDDDVDDNDLRSKEIIVKDNYKLELEYMERCMVVKKQSH